MLSIENKKSQDMRVINDPLGQTHSTASSDHYSRLYLRDFKNFGRTDGRTDRQHMRCKNIVITTGRACLWVGLVDQ